MKALLLFFLILVNIQSTQAVIMTGNGISNENGIMFTWEELANVTNQVKTLKLLCLTATAISAGTFLYTFMNQPSEKKSDQEIVDGTNNQ